MSLKAILYLAENPVQAVFVHVYVLWYNNWSISQNCYIFNSKCKRLSCSQQIQLKQQQNFNIIIRKVYVDEENYVENDFVKSMGKIRQFHPKAAQETNPANSWKSNSLKVCLSMENFLKKYSGQIAINLSQVWWKTLPWTGNIFCMQNFLFCLSEIEICLLQIIFKKCEIYCWGSKTFTMCFLILFWLSLVNFRINIQQWINKLIL